MPVARCIYKARFAFATYEICRIHTTGFSLWTHHAGNLVYAHVYYTQILYKKHHNLGDISQKCFFFYNLYWRILKYSFKNYHTVMILWLFSKYKCISKRNISYNLLGFEPTNVESFMRYTGVSRWTITTINKLKIKLMNDISEIS